MGWLAGKIANLQQQARDALFPRGGEFWTNLGSEGSVGRFFDKGKGNWWGNYAGVEAGRGWGAGFSGKMKERATSSLGKSMEQFKGGPSGRYGIGSTLKKSGVDWGFDPTSGQSLGEALARASFERDVQGQIESGGESDIYEGAPISSQGYADVDEGTIEDYWGDWYDSERQEGFANMGNLLALNRADVSQMDPGSKKWSDILNPQLEEATDLFRQGVGNIYAGLGDLRTGSCARRRKDLMGKHSQHILGMRSDVAGQRQQFQDKTLSSIISAFNEYT